MLFLNANFFYKTWSKNSKKFMKENKLKEHIYTIKSWYRLNIILAFCLFFVKNFSNYPEKMIQKIVFVFSYNIILYCFLHPRYQIQHQYNLLYLRQNFFCISAHLIMVFYIITEFFIFFIIPKCKAIHIISANKSR